MRAYCRLREGVWYRRQVFETGLARAGYEVLRQSPARAQKGDVLVVWNRYGGEHSIAEGFERGGGTVLVAENGYIGYGGVSPKFDVHPSGPKPTSFYALSIGFHNGRGSWVYGGPQRWASLGIELKPWRDGEHILVCPNRSFGVPPQVMPAGWAERTAARLKSETKRPIRIRAHPGNDEPKARPLAADLAGAHAVVVWSSSVALHALAEGIPTYIEAPWQVVKGASARGPVDAPVAPERLPHFEQMAWQQWTCAEIETGEPFRHLLRPAREGEVAPNP